MKVQLHVRALFLSLLLAFDAGKINAASLPAASATATKPFIYYVDGEAGDDSQSGTSPKIAWKTLEKVNAQVFQAGDQILFKAGTHYSGQLKPQGSGAVVNGGIRPIVIGRYDDGPLPRIDGEGRVLDTLLLRNVEFWEVGDLEISNLGEKREAWRTGVHVVADNFGTMRHIHLSRLFVHDVNGSLKKSDEGCGIYFESRGRQTASCFDDFYVEDCHVLRTDRNGICQRGGNPHSQHVVIRGNLLEDIGGDGIKVWGSDAPRVACNVLHGGRTRCDDYAAGIWPFDCNDAVIECNEVSGMRGTKDGQGFDSDYLCRRSVFQYNYSHDNEGGFMLICSPGNSFNENTVIRYNISQNDGINSARVFHISGAKNALIYNNTIYVGRAHALPLLLFSTWDGGRADGTQFLNNIFYVDGMATYTWDNSTNTVFSHNVFYGNHSEIPRDSKTFTKRPELDEIGKGRDGFDSISGYTPQRVADFPRGRLIPNNGGRDFFGRAVPTNQSPYVGAVSALGE